MGGVIPNVDYSLTRGIPTCQQGLQICLLIVNKAAPAGLPEADDMGTDRGRAKSGRRL
jgi:hypothetical protein